jgi:hypothetical protein
LNVLAVFPTSFVVVSVFFGGSDFTFALAGFVATVGVVEGAVTFLGGIGLGAAGFTTSDEDSVNDFFVTPVCDVFIFAEIGTIIFDDDVDVINVFFGADVVVEVVELVDGLEVTLVG